MKITNGIYFACTQTKRLFDAAGIEIKMDDDFYLKVRIKHIKSIKEYRVIAIELKDTPENELSSYQIQSYRATFWVLEDNTGNIIDETSVAAGDESQIKISNLKSMGWIIDQRRQK